MEHSTYLIPCKVGKAGAGGVLAREWYVLARLTTPANGPFLVFPTWLFADGHGIFVSEIMGEAMWLFINTAGNMKDH